MSESNYAPGTYVKGDVERVAASSRDAVALVFEGYKPKANAPVEGEAPKADAPVEVAQVDETPKPRAPRNRSDSKKD